MSELKPQVSALYKQLEGKYHSGHHLLVQLNLLNPISWFSLMHYYSIELDQCVSSLS